MNINLEGRSLSLRAHYVGRYPLCGLKVVALATIKRARNARFLTKKLSSTPTFATTCAIPSAV